MAQDRKAFLLRLPPDLWQELERWAADDLRSVNGQIEYLLRQEVQKHRRGRPADAQAESPAAQPQPEAPAEGAKPQAPSADGKPE